MRTALSVLFTCWPPAPCARYVSIFRSPSSISTSASSRQERRDDHRRERGVPAVRRSNGESRTSRCLPRSALRIPYAFSPTTRERRRLEARLLTRARLEQLDLEAAVRGPALVHAQHHLRPVLRIGPARARLQRHDRVAGVVLAVEERGLLRARRARDEAARATRRSRPPSRRRPSRRARARRRTPDAGAGSPRAAATRARARPTPSPPGSGRPRTRGVQLLFELCLTALRATRGQRYSRTQSSWAPSSASWSVSERASSSTRDRTGERLRALG